MESTLHAISPFLASEESIRQKLPSIFVDSVVLDNHFKILVVSQNVLDLLEFENSELEGQSINCLSGAVDLSAVLRHDLGFGYANEKAFTLFSKTRSSIPVTISGFYLGLVTDINGKIILMVRSKASRQEQVSADQIQAAIDAFIYRAGHDLRGPLATIKGLINLLKIRENNDEVDRLIQLIDSHANKLDERLFQLVYLAHHNSEKELPLSEINFSALETRLRKIIEKDAFIDFLEFNFEASSLTLRGLNEVLLLALCENLLHHVLAQPMKSMHNTISFRFERLATSLRLTITINGFDPGDGNNNLSDHSFQYTDLVKFPQLIYLYAAQKLATQLQSSMHITILASDRQRIDVRIPLL